MNVYIYKDLIYECIHCLSPTPLDFTPYCVMGWVYLLLGLVHRVQGSHFPGCVFILLVIITSLFPIGMYEKDVIEGEGLK